MFKTLLFGLFLLFGGMSQIVATPLTDAPAQLLIQQSKTKIWYHCGPLPTKFDQTFELTNEEFESLKFKSAKTLEKSKIPGVQALFPVKNQHISTSILFIRPTTNQSFVVQITHNTPKSSQTMDKKELSWTEIRIYGTEQKCPTMLLELTKSCFIQSGWTGLQKSCAAAMVLGGGYLLATHTAPRETLERELDEIINNQWHMKENFLKQDLDQATCITFYAHGWASTEGGCGGSSVGDKINEAFNNHIYNVLFQKICHKSCIAFLNSSRRYGSFAQAYDVYQMKKHLEKLIHFRNENRPELPIICFGHSNGASTLISTLCENPGLADQLKGLVLLAPYADIVETTPLKRIPAPNCIRRKLAQMHSAPNHDCSAPSPADLIKDLKFPQQLPTLILHAKNDEIVPHNNLEILQEAFGNKYQNVQCVSLNFGRHGLAFDRGGPFTSEDDYLRTFSFGSKGHKPDPTRYQAYLCGQAFDEKIQYFVDSCIQAPQSC